MLAGAKGQPSYSGVALTHFEEARGAEVSLDRLGASGIDRRVKRYLVPRAVAAGQTFRKVKRFDGWMIVPARELVQARKEPKLPVIASPVTDPEPNDNIYHAHVVRPAELNTYQMALHLRHIFTTYGRMEQHEADQEQERWFDLLRSHPFVRWIVAKFST